ncbi:MAG: Kelch repeat-containing protein [Deltaproteobacteria bacterium]
MVCGGRKVSLGARADRQGTAWPAGGRPASRRLWLAALLVGCGARPSGAPDAGAACGFTGRFGLSVVATGGFLVALGGTQVGPVAVMEIAGPEDRWRPANSLPSPRTWAGAAAVPGAILVAGGDEDGLSDGTSSVERFDLTSGIWSAAPPLPKPIWALAVAAGPDGTAYAVGGIAGVDSSPLASVEGYPPGAPGWRSLAPLATPRSFLGAAVGGDGRLYAAGGCALGCSAVFDRVEAFDPSTGSWTAVAPLPTARAQLAVTSGPDGRIYALGGIDAEGVPLAAVEAFDPSTGRWTSLAPLPTARSNLGAGFGGDGRLRAIGGEDQAFEPVDEIDVYDPGTGQWASVPCEPLDAGAPAPAVFSDLRVDLFQAEGCTKMGCHQAGAGPAVGSLDLETDPYAALLGPDGKGAPATNSQGAIRGLLRVDPGHPAQSLLWLKLSLPTVDYQTYGQPMPGEFPNATPPELLGELAEWIRAGAPGP